MCHIFFTFWCTVYITHAKHCVPNHQLCANYLTWLYPVEHRPTFVSIWLSFVFFGRPLLLWPFSVHCSTCMLSSLLTQFHFLLLNWSIFCVHPKNPATTSFSACGTTGKFQIVQQSLIQLQVTFWLNISDLAHHCSVLTILTGTEGNAQCSTLLGSLKINW